MDLFEINYDLPDLRIELALKPYEGRQKQATPTLTGFIRLSKAQILAMLAMVQDDDRLLLSVRVWDENPVHSRYHPRYPVNGIIDYARYALVDSPPLITSETTIRDIHFT